MVCVIFNFYKIDDLFKSQKNQVGLLFFIKIQFMDKDVVTWKKSRLALIYLQKCNSLSFYLLFEWTGKKEKKESKVKLTIKNCTQIHN